MKRLMFFLSSYILIGCSTLSPAPELPSFDGTSSLDETFKQEGYAAAYESTQTDGCSKIDRVVVGGFPMPKRQLESAGRDTSDILLRNQTLVMTEKWVLHGCGKAYLFWVNVSSDSNGQSVVDVRKIF